MTAVGIAARALDGAAHRGQVDHGRHAREVLHQHAARHERDVLGRSGPRGERRDVLVGHIARAGAAKQVLEQDPDGVRQPCDVADPLVGEPREPREPQLAVGDGKASLRAVEHRRHRRPSLVSLHPSSHGVATTRQARDQARRGLALLAERFLVLHARGAAELRGALAPAFDLGLDRDRRHRSRAAVVVERHEDEVRRRGVHRAPADRVLGLDPDPALERGGADVVDRGFELDDVADVDRLEERSISSTLTVTQRPSAWRIAASAAAVSASRMITPPWTLPATLASVTSISWVSVTCDALTGLASPVVTRASYAELSSALRPRYFGRAKRFERGRGHPPGNPLSQFLPVPSRARPRS